MLDAILKRRHNPSVRLAGFCWAVFSCATVMGGMAPVSPGITSASSPTYRVVFDSGASWTQASTDATRLGGTLASISSSGQEAEVTKLLVSDKAISGAYWIGLEKSTSGSFVDAATQQPPVYTHWFSGEPNNSGKVEKYGSIFWDVGSSPAYLKARSGYWNDLPNSGYRIGQRTVTADLVEQGYVVQFPASSSGTGASSGTGQSGSGSGTATGTVSAPLAPAAAMFPAGIAVALLASRRLSRRQAS